MCSMKLESDGILIALKPFSERDALGRIFTRDNGILVGMLRGAVRIWALYWSPQRRGHYRRTVTGAKEYGFCHMVCVYFPYTGYSHRRRFLFALA